ncbi:MAG: hypothetical protein LBK59_05110, partial [Bifidobacteriaceae bacterium]|nr:hypothetical protein [Bifidobacteriaceae bacterium]
MHVEPDDAVHAGRLWTQHPQLSLSGRFCLAVGHRRGNTIHTADRRWAAPPRYRDGRIDMAEQQTTTHRAGTEMAQLQTPRPVRPGLEASKSANAPSR